MTRMTGGRLLLLAGLATLSLTGCKSLYGDYERPEVKTDGIVRDPVNDQATLEGSNDFGNLPWRSVFTDPQLQSLIEKALANNPNLLNAMLNVAGGATWVSLHHGGGVGMGFSQHSGVVIVCDGSEAA